VVKEALQKGRKARWSRMFGLSPVSKPITRGGGRTKRVKSEKREPLACRPQIKRTLGKKEEQKNQGIATKVSKRGGNKRGENKRGRNKYRARDGGMCSGQDVQWVPERLQKTREKNNEEERERRVQYDCIQIHKSSELGKRGKRTCRTFLGGTEENAVRES